MDLLSPFLSSSSSLSFFLNHGHYSSIVSFRLLSGELLEHPIEALLMVILNFICVLKNVLSMIQNLSYPTSKIFQFGFYGGSDVSDNRVAVRRWERPIHGWIKCNFDGSFSGGHNRATSGWICRDSDGNFLSAGQATGNFTSSAMESEFQALLLSMKDCYNKGLKMVVFETDSKNLVDVLTGKSQNFCRLFG